MSLQQTIEKILAETSATFGVSIKHTATKEEVNINENKPFQMASVFKVPILLTLYEKAFNGEIDLTERVEITEEDEVPGSGVIQEMDPGINLTIKDLATLMIIVSDNLATDKLYHMLGKESIAQTLVNHGLDDIYIHQSTWDLLSYAVGVKPKSFSKDALDELNERLFSDKEEYRDDIVFKEDVTNNMSTPRAMTRLYEMLDNKQFISAECSEAVLDILSRQQMSQRIPGRLPFGTKAAHKTGSIGSAINDAGIVYLPDDKGAYIISLFSVDNETSVAGVDIASRISKAAYDYFLEQ